MALIERTMSSEPFAHLPKTIIAYRPDALAPHQGLLAEFIRSEFGDRSRVVIRTIPTGTVPRLIFAGRVAFDALFHRKAVLYFASFLSVVFASIAAFLGHSRWIYHSQDWIADQPGPPARMEPMVVRKAPVVIWNEPARAERAKEISGRQGGILVLPTYLPASYAVPQRSQKIRDELAAMAGVATDNAVIVFVGGGWSSQRLSPQFLAGLQKADSDIIAVFTGTTRIPDEARAPNVLDLGLLEYDRMLEVMGSCDIGLLLYDYAESFGHRNQQPGRLTEYLKGGLALIATPFLDSRRLEEETDFCLTVSGYDVDEIAVALREMAQRIRSDAVNAKSIREYVGKNMTFEPFAEVVLAEAFGRLP